MAIWQFKFQLIPRIGLIQIHGQIPSVIIEDDFIFSDTDSDSFINAVGSSYWGDGGVSSSIIEKIRVLLPQRKSWDEDAIMFGDSRKDEIEVWKEDLYIRFDLRNLNKEFIRRVLEIARKFDCLILVGESKKVVEPDFSVLLEEIKKSRAHRFCRNPINTLKNVKKKSDKECFLIFEAAFGEFRNEGRVTSVVCDQCKELIEIKELSSEVYEMNCSCGRFKDILKGI